MRRYYVYILTNKPGGRLYTGMTHHLVVRTRQYKRKVTKGFTRRYNLNKLVWLEEHDRAVDAIAREKQIKGWSRKKKIELIERMNPTWKDLYFFALKTSQWKF